MSEAERSEPWPERDVVEHQRQWEAFRARWSAHREAVVGPLEIKRTQLDREPPFAVVGREGDGQRVVVGLGRGEQPTTTFTRVEGGRRVSMRAAADVLGVHTVELERARAAILDGLEQSERTAGRTPAQEPMYEWVDRDLVPRYEEALGNGYLMAERTLDDHGINATAVSWTAEPLKLSDEQLEAFAVLGRSATANVADLLERSDRTEDVMVAVEVLTANPWDGSPSRESVDEQLHDRLAGVGLRSTGEQTLRTYDSHTVHGINTAGRQIASRCAAQDRPEVARGSGPAVREGNAQRRARRAPAGIRAEEPARPGRTPDRRLGR